MRPFLATAANEEKACEAKPKLKSLYLTFEMVRGDLHVLRW